MNDTKSGSLDREAFQRVWRRVMPEDRADCPFTLAEPAVAVQGPADIPRRPQEQGPRPVRPGAQGGQPTRPVLPPAVPQRPRPPQMGPGRPPQGNRPPVCLGEGSRDELPALERLMALTAEDRRVYRALERRWPRERLFTRLAQAKAEQLRRLSAARFLIDGRRWSAPSVTLPQVTVTLSQALRQRHREEQERAMDFFRAGGAANDPCLVALYRDIGRENQELARQIRARLERN